MLLTVLPGTCGSVVTDILLAGVQSNFLMRCGLIPVGRYIDWQCSRISLCILCRRQHLLNC